MLQNHTGTMARNYDCFFGKTDQDLEFFLSYSVRAQTVVEFCVGTGRLAIPMARAGARVIGVDLSAEMLSLCRSKAAESGTRLELQLGDMTSFDTGVTADLVVCGCRSFLHNLTRQAQIAALQNFKRHMGPGGRAIISAWYFDAARIQNLTNEAQKTRKYVSADGREWTTTIHHRRIDEVNQVVEATFAHFIEGRLIDENEVFFRWIHPPEFELLAELAGLTVEERFGDFRRTPFSGQEDLVWVLKHA